jgi:hypothetical protein
MDPQIRHVARLLRRAGSCHPVWGVATHSLHLLCNKTGFSLHEEYHMFTALERLVPALWLDAAGSRARPAATTGGGTHEHLV